MKIVKDGRMTNLKRFNRGLAIGFGPMCTTCNIVVESSLHVFLCDCSYTQEVDRDGVS